MTERGARVGAMGAELRDLLAFLRRPGLRRSLPRRPASMGRADWLGSIQPARLLRWACLLWVVNVAVLAPIAIGAAGVAGARHELMPMALSWWAVVLVAPLLEESLFRYGLRRPAKALLIVPVLGTAYMTGGGVLGTWGMVGALLLAAGVALWADLRWSFKAMRRYVRHFPWVFHGASLAFALMHLANFDHARAPWLLLPLLVLPQYVTGLVLGWLRVRTGMGAAMVLHGLFNAGPMLLLWWYIR